MTNSLGLPDSWCSFWVWQSQLTRIPLDQDNRETVNTTLLDCRAFLVGSQMYYSTSRSTHHNHFHPLNFNHHHHQCHLPLIKNSQDLPAKLASRVSQNSRLACIKLHQPVLVRATQLFKNNYSATCCCPQTKKHTIQLLNVYMVHEKKLCEWVNKYLTHKKINFQDTHKEKNKNKYPLHPPPPPPHPPQKKNLK